MVAPVLLVLILAAPAAADWVTTTLAVGEHPGFLSINPVTDRIYLTNADSVIVIDGATNGIAATIAVGDAPAAVAVNPVTNKVYVPSLSDNSVTVIDGATNGATAVRVGSAPVAVAVNPVTNRIYVPNENGDNVTVIDGATNGTTTVAVGAAPRAIAVNPVTNRIYVANRDDATVTVIDGANNSTALIHVQQLPGGVAVNPLTGKVYVSNYYCDSVTVIDGATNSTFTAAVGADPNAVLVNPVTGRVYVANTGAGSVSVMTDGPWNDTRVRAELNPAAGCTTRLARPALPGKAVNRLRPGHTGIWSVRTRRLSGPGPSQWATVTSGGGTDSLTWAWSWGADSLLAGENYVCCLALDSQAATDNNLGQGTPFVGNVEVHAVYRLQPLTGVEGENPIPASSLSIFPSPVAAGRAQMSWRAQAAGLTLALYDATGRCVIGPERLFGPTGSKTLDLGHLSTGAYVVRLTGRGTSFTRKIVVDRR